MSRTSDLYYSIYANLLDAARRVSKGRPYPFRVAAGGYRILPWRGRMPSDEKNIRDTANRIARGWKKEVVA